MNQIALTREIRTTRANLEAGRKPKEHFNRIGKTVVLNSHADAISL